MYTKAEELLFIAMFSFHGHSNVFLSWSLQWVFVLRCPRYELCGCVETAESELNQTTSQK